MGHAPRCRGLVLQAGVGIASAGGWRREAQLGDEAPDFVVDSRPSTPYTGNN